MNYISNPAEMCCCSLGENGDIFVRPMEVLVDLETGKPVPLGGRAIVGRTYKCEEMFALMRGYTAVKLYWTEEGAKADYVRLIAELDAKDAVFEV